MALTSGKWKCNPALSLLQEALACTKGAWQGREQYWLPPHWGGDADPLVIGFLHSQPARQELTMGIAGAAIRVITTENPATEASLGFSLMHWGSAQCTKMRVFHKTSESLQKLNLPGGKWAQRPPTHLTSSCSCAVCLDGEGSFGRRKFSKISCWWERWICVAANCTDTTKCFYKYFHVIP